MQRPPVLRDGRKRDPRQSSQYVSSERGYTGGYPTRSGPPPAPSVDPPKPPSSETKPPVNAVGNPSASSANEPPLPPLPVRPCEVCGRNDRSTFWCDNCGDIFCEECWTTQLAHRPGKKGPDGLPHEKADPRIVNRLKHTFMPHDDPTTQSRLHEEDESTTWFGVARDDNDLPMFADYGRYATLLANSTTGQAARYPQLVSFIGQTGAGKSTVVKMLIEQKKGQYSSDQEFDMFPTPIVGSARDDSVPTSADVHLYADPLTYLGPFPMLYADCEGLEGGENDPISLRLRESVSGGPSRQHAEPLIAKEGKLQKIRKVARGDRREIKWAKSDETARRQFAVTELYPRLLYTFSDTIVFVLKNAKAFEATVLNRLLDWASVCMEKSLNQPTLPHAIIALNATDMAIDEREWDTDFATGKLLATVAGLVTKDAKYNALAQQWRNRGKTIQTMRDLLECYYSSVRVVRIPTKGRYMLMDQQVTKLHEEITNCCKFSYYTKRRSRMLSTSDELHVYLQSAFDHFSANLDKPFNFIEVAFKLSPIPLDIGGNILRLAVAIRNINPSRDAYFIFREMSSMVASCIILDCTRQNLRGTPDVLFKKFYLEHCLYALDDFCALFWPCEFGNKKGRCVNVQEGHKKGHQNERGHIIATGEYQSKFTVSSFEEEWLNALEDKVRLFQDRVQEAIQDPQATEARVVADLHRDNMEDFYKRLGGATRYHCHSSCFCCLRELPEHPLPCGHVLCSACVMAYSSETSHLGVRVDRCPLHDDASFDLFVKRKPALAGIRVLTLDGGGIRGIVELLVLREIERKLGGSIPVQNFFDLIVGTSTGGIIALGLGVEHWSVEACINKFMRLAEKAFTPRVKYPKLRLRYRSRPFEETLQQEFGETLLFGGHQERSDSYHTKVAITATTDTGEQAVVFTNYNRQSEDDTTYTFIRPDIPTLEMKKWEAARATSAAPGFFKPFVNPRTKQGFLDGALFHNNPVRLAFSESKLLWPDVGDCNPDVFLSLGTGHNGIDTPGQAELLDQSEHASRNLALKQARLSAMPARQKGFGQWVRSTYVGQFFTVMMNRVDNIINAEQIWNEFKANVKILNPVRERARFVRLNPKLDNPPPRMDDKSLLHTLHYWVAKALKTENMQSKISIISLRLVASSFYFEQRQVEVGHGSYRVRGRLRCRFMDDDCRGLGHLLRQYQQTRFQPYFRISEEGQDYAVIKHFITPDVIAGMTERAKFDFEPINVRISEQKGPVSISLALVDKVSRKENLFPISGFPRALVADKPGSMSEAKTANARSSTIARKSVKVSQRRSKDIDARLKRLSSASQLRGSGPVSRPSSESSTSISEHSTENTDGNNDWVSRRALTRSHRREAYMLLERSSSSSQSSLHESPSPFSPLEDPFRAASPGEVVEEDLDEDEAQLQEAIKRSLQQPGDEILRAIEKSLIEQ